MCSPLNQRKSLIHICCSKWLCILWHYRFSCCHPCSSSSTVCSIFCQEQTLVAQTAEEEVLHLSLFLPEAASPCEAWCGGKDSHERAEERLGAARHAQGGIADCHSCRGPQPASQREDWKTDISWKTTGFLWTIPSWTCSEECRVNHCKLLVHSDLCHLWSRRQEGVWGIFVFSLHRISG